MDPERAKFWTRSRPLVGTVGGFAAAASLHLLGVPSDAVFHDGLETLFATAPAVGYVGFTVAGFLVAWVFRTFEDRYVYE